MSNESKELKLVQGSGELVVKREELPWDVLMERATILSKSNIIPAQFQRQPENVLIALDLASRMGQSPIILMQNLYIIQGKPSLSGQMVASLVRTSGQFENLELHYVGTPNTDTWGAYVSGIRNGKELKGTVVTLGMAKKEGWYGKNGSKWQTIPQQMMGYRAWTYFGRLYAPEVLMGLHETTEVEDFIKIESTEVENPYEVIDDD